MLMISQARESSPKIELQGWSHTSVSRAAHLAYTKPGSHLLNSIHQAWRHIPVVPALGRWRQEDEKFKIIFSYIASLRPT